MGLIWRFFTNSTVLKTIAGLAIFQAGMNFVMHKAEKLTPTPMPPQAVVLDTDPNSAPFDGQDLTPDPHVPTPSHGAGGTPEQALLHAATLPDSSTTDVEKIPGPTPAPGAHAAPAPEGRTLEELVTAFVRNYDSLKDAHARKDTHHKNDYLKERERLASEISHLVPSQASEKAPESSPENDYLNARAAENPEAIEDLRFCLDAIEQQKTAAIRPASN